MLLPAGSVSSAVAVAASAGFAGGGGGSPRGHSSPQAELCRLLVLHAVNLVLQRRWRDAAQALASLSALPDRNAAALCQIGALVMRRTGGGPSGQAEDELKLLLQHCDRRVRLPILLEEALLQASVAEPLSVRSRVRPLHCPRAACR